MRGNLDSIAFLPRVTAGNSPLIRPAATFPQRGKALHKRLPPSGEAAARRRLMRGGLTLLSFYRVAAGNSPLIRPAATFPRMGKALPKRLPPSGEAAARRRLMRGSFNSIVPLPSYRRKLAPHPACGHLPPQGEGSPKKASPPGRSCRPQAADEGGVFDIALLLGNHF